MNCHHRIHSQLQNEWGLAPIHRALSLRFALELFDKSSPTLSETGMIEAVNCGPYRSKFQCQPRLTSKMKLARYLRLSQNCKPSVLQSVDCSFGPNSQESFELPNILRLGAALRDKVGVRGEIFQNSHRRFCRGRTPYQRPMLRTPRTS